jgi:hypothetical protein
MDKKTFLILQYDNRKIEKNFDKLMKINKKYCSQHNYKYIFVKKMYDLPAYWIKVYLVCMFLQTQKYKGVLWLDTDACIYNFDIRLEDILIKDKHFYMSSDNKLLWSSPFNAGVFLALNTEMGMNIMNDWMNCYNKNKWQKKSQNEWIEPKNCDWAGACYEQGSFVKSILPKYNRYIHKFHWTFFQSSFNSLLDKSTKCVFTLHFAGKLTEKNNFKKELPLYLQFLKGKKTNKNTRKSCCKFLKGKTRKQKYI